MYTFREKRDKIIGKDLDEYLAKGWYRMGNSIFTCQFLLQKRELFSATWIRLHLKDFSFNKRNRKTLSRNGKRFHYKVSKATFTEEKEQLYKKYRESFDGFISENLIANLHEGDQKDVFDTWNIEVYEGEKLVALSFFDVGDTSIASILGIYDPDYSKFSLGYYTLLLEVQQGLSLGKEYFYPGYIVHDNPRFDYKIKIGDVEYYDFLEEQWVDEFTFYQKEIMVDQLMNRLFELNSKLILSNIRNSVYLYPFYEVPMYFLELDKYLEHPVYLEIGNSIIDGEEKKERIIVVFDLTKERYFVFSCKRLIDIDLIMALKNIAFQNISMKDQILFSSPNVEDICTYFSNHT